MMFNSDTVGFYCDLMDLWNINGLYIYIYIFIYLFIYIYIYPLLSGVGFYGDL